MDESFKSRLAERVAAVIEEAAPDSSQHPVPAIIAALKVACGAPARLAPPPPEPVGAHRSIAHPGPVEAPRSFDQVVADYEPKQKKRKRKQASEEHRLASLRRMSKNPCLLLGAARPPVDGASLDWFSWRFLRGLRSLLCMDSLAYKTYSRGWYAFLRSLANKSATLRGYTPPADPGADDEAKRLWIREAQELLKKHFSFDSLRMILCMRSLGGNFGNMQRMMRMMRSWSLISELSYQISKMNSSSAINDLC